MRVSAAEATGTRYPAIPCGVHLVHVLLSAMTDAGQSPGAYGEYVVLVWKNLHNYKIGEGRPSSHTPIPSITPKAQRATQ